MGHSYGAKLWGIVMGRSALPNSKLDLRICAKTVSPLRDVRVYS